MERRKTSLPPPGLECVTSVTTDVRSDEEQAEAAASTATTSAIDGVARRAMVRESLARYPLR
jgi:hypothetical protein